MRFQFVSALSLLSPVGAGSSLSPHKMAKHIARRGGDTLGLVNVEGPKEHFRIPRIRFLKKAVRVDPQYAVEGQHFY